MDVLHRLARDVLSRGLQLDFDLLQMIQQGASQSSLRLRIVLHWLIFLGLRDEFVQRQRRLTLIGDQLFVLQSKTVLIRAETCHKVHSYAMLRVVVFLSN